jgi:hypothetical protein
MNIETILAEILEPELLPGLLPTWEQSLRELPQPDAPSFLSPEIVTANREYCGLSQEFDRPLLEAAQRIRSNPALYRLAWHYDWRIYDSPTFDVARWPRLEHALGEQAGLFYLLISLDMAPRIRRYHRLLGIPEHITRDTAQQVRCFCENHQRAHQGRPGAFASQVGWQRNYVRDALYFRLGRLEFWAQPYEKPFTVFRHRQTGQVVALANDGLSFNTQGFMDEAEKMAACSSTWTATLRLDDSAVCGYPIRPEGCALHEEIRLPFTEWRQALCKGDPVLNVHIPSGGDMSLEKCLDSFRQACDFFRAYFPRRAPLAFDCESWIFSPLLEGILPPASNLVRLLKETYLLPNPATGPDALWFVFFQDRFDLATAPRDTSLQRALLKYVASGQEWRNGGMFLLVDDLEHFGAQYYRTAWNQDAGFLTP